ncbi:dynein regulatory complex protein 11-like [Parasteatoda tepidariorum]|uniref:dynein regulatory complex protein 11-like n=1 Tax=Parasteatoda tepidariorum TaxID=114398 RepID=UPI001C728D41|nr:dynein regulatory complex protein 11-like [Parasteatoda tepidariorum]
MSNKKYNDLWKSTQADLEKLLEEELIETSALSDQERLKAIRKSSVLYLKYIKVSNKLIDCHRNILQPQKRNLLQKLIDNCIGRVLELKHELVGLEFSEIQFLDEVLLELKMVPSEMDIKIPMYFYDKSTEEQEKHALIVELLKYITKETSIKHWGTQRMSVKEAVSLILNHDRARRGRMAFLDAQRLFEIKEENRLKECRKNLKEEIAQDVAATRIQRAWRWFIFHKKFRTIYDAEMNLLGMQPSVADKVERFHALQQLKELQRNRRALILKNEAEYLDAIKDIKKGIETFIAPQAMEDLRSKIRSYFEDYRKEHGEYPSFPSEEEGGSSVFLKDVKENDQEKAKEGASKEKAIERKEVKESGEKEDSSGYVLKTSKYVPELCSLTKEYNNIWKERQPLGFFDKFDEDMIRKEAMTEMELRVRLIVDKDMREELHRLIEAYEKDLGKKGKKGGKKGGKKDKGKSKGKGKKEKDLTPNRSFESLVEELIKEKIIISYPKFFLTDFIGDYNYAGSVLESGSDPEKDPVPCLADIRRLVNEYCILPMGSSYIHSKGTYVKSILFAGPHGVGKKSLIHAICNEIGAILMDLSAENVNGKYIGKEGLDMLMHLITKVGKLAQPAVIYIGDAENYFWKKQATTSVLVEAQRLKKELPKLIKGIGNDDRIMICGTTVTPFDADLKSLSSCYNKVICISKPDHNCRRALWSEMILNRRGIITPEMGLSTLCGVSEGFTAPHIKSSVEQAIAPEFRRDLHQARL